MPIWAVVTLDTRLRIALIFYYSFRLTSHYGDFLEALASSTLGELHISARTLT